MRIRISKESELILDKLKGLYGFKKEGVLPRIAIAYSLKKGKVFNLESSVIPNSDGRDYRDENSLFGTVIKGESNYPIFKAIFDQHYNTLLLEEDFSKLFKLHLDHGLLMLQDEVLEADNTSGNHIKVLMRLVKEGLDLRRHRGSQIYSQENINLINDYTEPLSFSLGKLENGEEVEIKINDLNHFDNRNIAIAGMAGSGKTQLIKDILFQISKNTDNKLKFIFFDYKGEGNIDQLKPFLDSTNCEFIDILKDNFKFNPLASINLDSRQRIFSIKAFVDTIATFVPNIGIKQKHTLQEVITDLFNSLELGTNQENNKSSARAYPSIRELFTSLSDHYEVTGTKPDALYAAIEDLSSNLFADEVNNIFEKSIYLNLPPSLSDTLRQLVVFLLLRYFNSYFSSTNDVQPNNNIIPLRYIIVVDEAHIYLKNRNARKALEELLRLLRSKGVIVVMLTQGVEDYKTKDFDFASQVKLPICLNVQNKDLRLITSFLGTPKSKLKLETELSKLSSGFGLINISEPQIVALNQFWRSSSKYQL
jgi:DNA sulfur modification protein DndE